VSASATLATLLVDAMVGEGVRDVVLCPGSRSAPLAYALHAADAEGRVRLHVRIDERAAGFTALGLSSGAVDSGPAAVVTTSGTAVANLHPAVLEAHESGVPLLVLTADRPHRLRGTWANQTTALQSQMFGAATRYAADLPAGPADAAAVAAWRGAVVDAVRGARGRPFGPRPGPAHLDLGFDDPLAPDGAVRGLPPPAESSSARPPTPDTPRAEPIAAGPRTVVLAGAGAAAGARGLAEAAGWPLLAEPSSGARCGPNAVGPYRLLLDVAELGGHIERAVVFGRPTLSRPVTRLLDSPDVELVLVGRHPGEPGPGRAVRRILGPVLAPAPAADDWLTEWRDAARVAGGAVDAVLEEAARRPGGQRLSGPLVAREVAAASGDGELVVAAASNAVRDLDLAGRPWDRPPLVLANRGLSGIDGTLSTAAGAALASGRRARVLVGDLAFLHDLNGLLLGPGEPQPDVQVVVLNDDGGGIFALLEHGEPRHAAVFERVFGTPHGTDLSALCAGLGVPHRVVSDVGRLREALGSPPQGRSVVEVAASRAGLRDLHGRIRDAVAAALALAPRQQRNLA
jgi:2-succinyl-5-enolpyruvyl-6-hydroxy-3-cyclohexene-1-carboxylate synthase